MRKINLVLWALCLSLALGLCGCAGEADPPDAEVYRADVQQYLSELVDSKAVLDTCDVTKTEETDDELVVTCETTFSGSDRFTGGAVTLTYSRSGGEWELSKCRAALEETKSSYYGLAKIKDFEDHSYCFFMLEQIHTWEEAARYCESLGGHLATITSEEENDFLYSFMRGCGLCTAYFGFSDAEEEGNWKWVTGEEVNYTNWYKGEPNNAGNDENEAAFYFSDNTGKWNDGKVGVANGGNAFICEWDTVRTESLNEG